VPWHDALCGEFLPNGLSPWHTYYVYTPGVRVLRCSCFPAPHCHNAVVCCGPLHPGPVGPSLDPEISAEDLAPVISAFWSLCHVTHSHTHTLYENLYRAGSHKSGYAGWNAIAVPVSACVVQRCSTSLGTPCMAYKLSWALPPALSLEVMLPT